MTFAVVDGNRIRRALIHLPYSGEWWGDFECDAESDLTGAQTLTFGDLTLVGTVRRGGSWQGMSSYRITGGAGAWGTELPPKGYAGGGVYARHVLGDLAAETGETVASGYTDAFLGEVWARERGPGRRILDRLVGPAGWYVSTAGATVLTARTGAAVAVDYRVTSYDPAQQLAVVATEEPAAFQPAATVAINGSAVAISSVVLELGEEFRLHLTVDGQTQDRLQRAIRAIVRDELAEYRYHGIFEYRVYSQDGATNLWHLQAVDSSAGLPDLQSIPLRPGLPGGNATLDPGHRVLVGFVNADPGRPVVLAYEDPDGDGWMPPSVELTADAVNIGESSTSTTVGNLATATALGSAPRLGVARQTDQVTVGGFGGTITSSSITVTAGS